MTFLLLNLEFLKIISLFGYIIIDFTILESMRTFGLVVMKGKLIIARDILPIFAYLTF